MLAVMVNVAKKGKSVMAFSNDDARLQLSAFHVARLSVISEKMATTAGYKSLKLTRAW